MSCTHIKHHFCIDSRKAAEHRRRRYHCGKCGLRWSTIEIEVGVATHRRKKRGSPLLKLLADKVTGQTEEQRNKVESLVTSLRELTL